MEPYDLHVGRPPGPWSVRHDAMLQAFAQHAARHESAAESLGEALGSMMASRGG